MPNDFHIGPAQTEDSGLRFSSSRQEAKEAKTFEEKLNDFADNFRSIKSKDLVVFFRLLAVMINAGVSLLKSLKVLAKQSSNGKMRKILEQCALNIENGMSFSDSMQEFPEAFDESQIGMVGSGEASGKLNEILVQLANQVEKSTALRSKIKHAMIYPMAILTVVIVVGILMMYFVIPKLISIFRDAKVELPTMTKIIVAFSDFLQTTTLGIPNILNIFIVIFLIIFGFLKWKKTRSGKAIWSHIILKIPLFGSLFQKAILAQFCRGLSSLTSSGISIVKSLQIVSDIVGNEVYRQRILMIAEDVKRGISIGENLKDDTKLFPAMVATMILVGEQTAQLDTVCEKVANFYQDEVDDMLKNLSALLEPFIIVIIGAGVGVLVAAIMKPIMMLSDVASQM